MTVTITAHDLAVDHTLALLSDGIRFLLDVTPVDAEEQRAGFLSGAVDEPAFTYRELEADPDVLQAQLEMLPIGEVEDRTLADLLRGKQREMLLQLEMLRTRGTEDFRQLSVELFGAVSPSLREAAEGLVERLDVSAAPGSSVDAPTFLRAAQAEIDLYREVDPDVSIYAEIRSDVSGVLVARDTLLIAENAKVASERVQALIQHEVGTHLVTQVNGAAQPVKTLGSGLAGYDETQEGLAVLGEIAVGGLTPSRLRQLAVRVLTVHRMLGGATFRESFDDLVELGLPAGAAYTTTMRVYRAGGLTKDAIYLRGLLDLLAHLRAGGGLELMFLGKFAVKDLPLVQDLDDRGLLVAPRITTRWLQDPNARERLWEAASTEDLTTLTKGL